MKVLFCDDDVEFLKQLENDFYVYFKDRIFELETKCLYQNFVDLQKYDICFLDIDLKSVDGIALAKRLKTYNSKLIIVFVSQREDLVFHTFSVQPFQFIRKKHYLEDSKEVFAQLNYYLQQTTMPLKINNQIVYINPLDITSVISLDHDVIITTKEKTYTVKDSLKNFCQKNEKFFVVQIKKNLAISLYQVQKVKGNKIMYENKEYIIGRIYQKNFKNLYERYLMTCL
ncbi:response regulator [Faecalibacillus intestinalis]|jgi:DNA-binding LytR/AlgR family response regulator|uniref:Response regulator n=1 Tax=Faecalibacillus intestinalis TaxID=1982626 RepID=A0AAP2UH38_9FIRM|nr:response regulator [Faecalibacillus intestinalis]RGE95995.1 response regulator [Coprobacillus sp. AM23-9LB]RGI25974.1 response regulator [Coprobacillus sp. OM08-19]RHR92311.1 response regulator [Coprobacillus sp. AF15-30]MCB8591649.1 response regulator [Faecalibacillus intestinalis]MCB8612401.1 response regulator [Faecalibacillus intestinalis]